QSSRRLERECGRNVELIWLTGSLKPDFKTIADFRRENGQAIRNVCRQFVALCRDINLLNNDSVAIDGSKFKAVNAKAKNFTREKLRKRFREIDERIQRYLSELDRSDEVHSATGMPVSDAQSSRRKQTNSLRSKLRWTAQAPSRSRKRTLMHAPWRSPADILVSSVITCKVQSIPSIT
ncbi:MAG: transposase, partial [Pseudomonadota bacterium]